MYRVKSKLKSIIDSINRVDRAIKMKNYPAI